MADSLLEQEQTVVLRKVCAEDSLTAILELN
jgi:hypothetical protein